MRTFREGALFIYLLIGFCRTCGGDQHVGASLSSSLGAIDVHDEQALPALASAVANVLPLDASRVPRDATELLGSDRYASEREVTGTAPETPLFMDRKLDSTGDCHHNRPIALTHFSDAHAKFGKSDYDSIGGRYVSFMLQRTSVGNPRIEVIRKKPCGDNGFRPDSLDAGQNRPFKRKLPYRAPFFKNSPGENSGESSCQSEFVEIMLPGYGPVVGTREISLKEKEYLAFKGIPYSKAGRFQDFVAPEPWEIPLDATKFGPTCFTPAGSSGSSEDCLYINVFTSNLDPRDGQPSRTLVSVLVYLHGGGFVWGDGNVNPVYFMDSKIVVVSLNYRLGPFGFLFSPEPEANIRGNYGLKDQIQALLWVQAVIPAFGGDPSNVTLMGLSAGAGSVHLLMLAEHLTEGLFHRAITISKTALSPSSVQRDPEQTVVRLARAVACLGQDDNMTAAAYECIRATDALTLSTSWTSEFTMSFIDLAFRKVWAGQPFTFVPAIDKVVILDDPEKLLKAGHFLKIPWLAGCAKDEGSMLIGDALRSFESMSYLNNSWIKSVCPYAMEMLISDFESAVNACELATTFYMGNADVSFNTIYEFMQMVGDRLYKVALDRSAVYHASVAPFFGYTYEYQSHLRGFLANYYDCSVPENVPRLLSMVPHGEEVVQLFLDDRYPPIEPGDPDEFVHDLLLGSLLAFIEHGVPDFPGSVNYDLKWPKFTADAPRIQVVDKYPRVATHFTSPSSVHFWESIMEIPSV